MQTSRHSDALTERTIRDFGDQWTRFRANAGYYGSLQLLADILEPLLPVREIAGKRVAEIGSGNGRVVNMLLDAGAGHVIAIEPSAAFSVLKANVRSGAAVTLLNVPGDLMPANGDLDLVVSIGVIHHIPRPASTMCAAVHSLRPGGKMLVWLYGREGNGLYLALAQPLRALTRRLPHWLLVALVRLLYLPLAVLIGLARSMPVPMRDYLKNYLTKLSPEQRRLVMYDQLNPAYAKYYSAAEARALLEQAGFVNVRLHHRHGYSWTVIGERPQDAASESKAKAHHAGIAGS